MAAVGEIVCDKYSAPISAWAAESIARIRAMAPAELQQYAESPPGKGWGVIYVGLNVFNGKPYTGLHGHNTAGVSVYRSRWKHHVTNHLLHNKFRNGITKWGPSAFVWLILSRVSTELLNDAEIAMIAKLDSVKNGYNTEMGGAGNAKSMRGLEAIRAASREPTKRQKHRDSSLDQWKDPEFKERQHASRKRSWTKPERKEAASVTQKALWTPEYTSKMSAKRVVTNAQPETKKKIGDASKRTWQAPGHRDKMVQIRKDSYKGEAGAALKEVIGKNSTTMWKNPEYRKAKTNEINVWRNDDAVRAKRRATILKKRELVLLNCTTEAERKKKIKQYASTDLTQARTFAASGAKHV